MIGLLFVGSAFAAGYRYLEVGGLYGEGSPSLVEPTAIGSAADDQLEAGFQASLFNDGLVYWMTFGDPSIDGHRVKEAWLESHHYGLQLGQAPAVLRSQETRKLPMWLEGIGWFRVGADHTARKTFEIDSSRHFVLTLPGFWNVSSDRFHFGPTAGIGWNLTWWENWKDTTDKTVSTGKLTAEAGWVLGAMGWDTVFVQGRATYHYDLFGIHQTQLKVAAITGFYLDRAHVPLGLQLEGELDRGNDTVTTELLEWWAARVALVYHVVPKKKDPDLEEMLETLRKLQELEPPADTEPVAPDDATEPEVPPEEAPPPEEDAPTPPEDGTDPI